MDIALIRYIVDLADLERHRFVIECVVPNPEPAQGLRLPSWIPGSYLMREFARHVVSIEAGAGGAAADVEKVDKSTWVCRGAASELRVRIEVHAFDRSVRGAYLDRRRAFFNGTCLLLEVLGRERELVELELVPPPHAACASWRVATALAPHAVDERGFGAYRAADYDELIDHPVEIGDFASVSFEAGRVPHRFVLAGRADTDLERVATDLSQLCAAHIDFFGAPAPFASYTFLGLAAGDGFGGLEHRASSSLIFERDDLPKPGEPGVPHGYQRFLALVSHEYFHAWHVKRTKPAAFVPYRLEHRAHTRQLWIFEGITTYYQDLLVLRSGLVGVKDYLRRLGELLTRVYRVPGRLRQSISDASFDAWDKLYKPEADSPNSTISYYSKGALVALALDLTLRRDGKTTLDSVIRELWASHGARGLGVSEHAFERSIVELGGPRYEEFFAQAVRGTRDLELAPLLADFGLHLSFRAQESPTDTGGTPPTARATQLGLGVTFAVRGDGIELQTVLDGGPAQQAGLNPGDVMIAIDDLKIGERNLAKRLARYEPGERVSVTAFRGDELLRFTLELAEALLDTCWLELDACAASGAAQRRQAWLGE